MFCASAGAAEQRARQGGGQRRKQAVEVEGRISTRVFRIHYQGLPVPYSDCCRMACQSRRACLRKNLPPRRETCYDERIVYSKLSRSALGALIMSDSRVSRRQFVRDAAAAAAGVAAGLSTMMIRAGNPEKADTSKILNYNPKMTYRRLGKTGFMISEVALGGHGGKTPEDRLPVLERAVELGMNYVDNNIVGECDLYGTAMARSKTAGRDKWFIGFASWPEKITDRVRVATHACKG